MWTLAGTIRRVKRRIAGLAVVVAALWAAAVVAWVDAWPVMAGQAGPAPMRYLPPRVEVDAGVDVDQAQVAAYVQRVVNDPRGWHMNLDLFTLRIVKPGTEGVDPPGGYYIGRAYIPERYVAISSYAWTTLGPHFAAVGGTLDDQRTWIVLHELGHLIGHVDHEPCPGPGQPAPVMRTATYALDGCTLNVWPNPDPS